MLLIAENENDKNLIKNIYHAFAVDKKMSFYRHRYSGNYKYFPFFKSDRLISCRI